MPYKLLLNRICFSPKRFHGDARSVSGDQCSRCSGQVRVREDVPVDGDQDQRDAGHQAAPAVLHRSAGHRRLRDLRCELRSGPPAPANIRI